MTMVCLAITSKPWKMEMRWRFLLNPATSSQKLSAWSIYWYDHGMIKVWPSWQMGYLLPASMPMMWCMMRHTYITFQAWPIWWRREMCGPFTQQTHHLHDGSIHGSHGSHRFPSILLAFFWVMLGVNCVVVAMKTYWYMYCKYNKVLLQTSKCSKVLQTMVSTTKYWALPLHFAL